MLESGTPNTAGLAGLRAGLAWLAGQGVENIRRHEEHLCALLLEGLAQIPGVNVYGTGQASRQTAMVAFNMAGMPPSEAGLRLDEEFGILCRVGLHCAPAAHRTLGTFPDGSVRFGLGAFNTEEDVDLCRQRRAAAGQGGSNNEHQYAVILVDSTSHAMRIEHVLAMVKLETKLIPVPRHLSSNCGLCVRVRREDIPAIQQQLKKNKVAYNGIVEIE